MRVSAIACIDIGKTNRRVLLIDAATGAEIDRLSEPNGPRLDGPYPALDLDATTRFIETALTRFAGIAEIRTIATSAHGAAFVIVKGHGLALPALDYEFDGPDHLAEYDQIRPAFSETFSPALPGGLNAGRGLYWLARTFPDAFARGDAILSLNQYLTFWLSGVAASECTSLGCHTDLWDQGRQRLSSMVERLGWSPLFPPLTRPGDPLGTLRADLATRTGLPRDALVLCGIHDSNATLVPYLTGQAERRTVFSTGTWIVGFSLGGSTDRLDETRDCLANADYLGRPTPSARMMGGREFALLTDGAPDQGALPPGLTPDDIPLPGFAPGTGPFAWRTGQLPPTWVGRAPSERVGLASLYCAFHCAVMSQLIDGAGPVIVEGVFARNPIFLAALAQASDSEILVSADATGTIAGLTILAGLNQRPDLRRPALPDLPDLKPIFEAWRARVERPADH